MGRSRLQKDVLKLYRQCLRAAEGKPGTASTIKAQFRVNAAIPKYIIKLSLLYNKPTVWFRCRNETMRIEYLLRQGWRKLEMLQNPTTSGMGHFVEGARK